MCVALDHVRVYHERLFHRAREYTYAPNTLLDSDQTMRKILFKVFGKRVAFLFGAICFITVAALSSVYLTIEYSLENYLTEQLGVIPWDANAIQKNSLQSYKNLQSDYKKLDFVRSVESLSIARFQRGNGVVAVEVDGNQLAPRWVMLIATSDDSLLPSGLEIIEQQPNKKDRQKDEPGHDHTSEVFVTAAILSGDDPKSEVSDIHIGSKIKIYSIEDPNNDNGLATPHSHRHGGMPTHQHTLKDMLLTAEVRGTPLQLERVEFNKWMLSHIGSLVFLPENSLVLAVPTDLFEQLTPMMDKLFIHMEGIHGGVAAPPYLTEISHLINFNRENFLSTWDIEVSIENISSQLTTILSMIRDITPSSFLNSDALATLEKMRDVSQAVGMVTLLISIPLLWLICVVARILCKFVLFNQRRVIGLSLVRGVSLTSVNSTFKVASISGCLVGGILGLSVGVGIVVINGAGTGKTSLPLPVLYEGIPSFLLFLIVGVGLSLLVGRGVLTRIAHLSPVDAISRSSQDYDIAHASHASKAFSYLMFAIFVLGSYKLTSWIAGFPLLLRLLVGSVSEQILQFVMLIESFLNFAAVPFFLAGVMFLFRWRQRWFLALLDLLSAPVLGKFHRFFADHMALARVRITSVVFVTALAVSLALLPQIAADSFYNRLIRGADISLGSDLLLEYNMRELANNEGQPAPIGYYLNLTDEKLFRLEKSLESNPRVESVLKLREYFIPDFYLPSQSKLVIDLIEDPDEYLSTVRYDEVLGRSQPFSKIIEKLSDSNLTSSSGLLRVRDVPLNSDIIFGQAEDSEPIVGQVRDLIAFLPGQAGVGVIQREGYKSAESDYLNYVVEADARLIASLEGLSNSPLSKLGVTPSRVVFLINIRENFEITESSITDLIEELPFKPYNFRWVDGERNLINKDMFISLVLDNMNLFVLGALLLAITGISAVGLVNFQNEARTFKIMRLRGIPFHVLFRMSLSMFLIPVVVGIVLGILLGAISGYGIAQAIWEFPRVYGVAGLLDNVLVFTSSAWRIVASFAVALTVVTLIFANMPFRGTPGAAIREG